MIVFDILYISICRVCKIFFNRNGASDTLAVIILSFLLGATTGVVYYHVFTPSTDFSRNVYVTVLVSVILLFIVILYIRYVHRDGSEKIYKKYKNLVYLSAAIIIVWVYCLYKFMH